jgi:YD repeat-containing protein
VRVLNDGAVQMYLRDPAGNLVEVNWPDAGTLDRSVVTTMKSIADERPQSDEALRATLYPQGQVRA